MTFPGGDTVTYHPRFSWRGKEYSTVRISEMTWAEVDMIEQVTGLTAPELDDPHLARFSRVSLAHALVAIHRVQRAAGEDLTSYEEFREEPVRNIQVIPTPLPPDPAADAAAEKAEAELNREKPPADTGTKPAHPDNPVYDRLGDADPTVADTGGSAPTSLTSEPSTSEPSPEPSGSGPGNGTG